MTTAALLDAIKLAIGERGWAVVASSLAPRLKRLFRDSAVQFIHDASVERPDFSLLDRNAANYAAQRSGELIKDLASTTPDLLRATVEKALAEGWSSAKLSDELAESYAFSDARALTIARTELSRARSHGVDTGARVASFDQKSWTLVDAACPICQMNAGAGWIAIDSTFPSGDALSPTHPNCSCGVAYRRRERSVATSAFLIVTPHYESRGVPFLVSRSMA